MNLKKLLTTVVFVLGAWTSSGAQAQTNYDFGLTFAYPIDVTTGTLTTAYAYTLKGTGVDANNNGILSSLTATSLEYRDRYGSNTWAASNSSTSSGTILFDPTNPFFSYSGTSAVPTSLSGLTFTANGINYSFGFTGPIAGEPNGMLPPGTYVALLGSGVSPNLLIPANISYTSIVTTSAIQSAGAPEMNASFIPQVALMLACLFFLFGRKKENTDAILAS